MASASGNTTQDHDFIREWAEKRGGKPAEVASTEQNGQPGILRLEFPDAPYANDGALTEISWDEFFEKFDQSGLELLYQEQTADGELSNFNKLIYPEPDSTAGKRLLRKTAAKRSASKKTVGSKSTAKTAVKKSPAKTVAAKKTPAKKIPGKKVAGKKVAAKKVVAKKVAAKKTSAKKTVAKKVVAKKAPAKKIAGKKVATKKIAGRKSTR